MLDAQTFLNKGLVIFFWGGTWKGVFLGWSLNSVCRVGYNYKKNYNYNYNYNTTTTSSLTWIS